MAKRTAPNPSATAEPSAYQRALDLLPLEHRQQLLQESPLLPSMADDLSTRVGILLHNLHTLNEKIQEGLAAGNAYTAYLKSYVADLELVMQFYRIKQQDHLVAHLNLLNFYAKELGEDTGSAQE